MCDLPECNNSFFCVQPLESALKSALKGDLEEVVLALLKTPAQYDAQQLKLAMKVKKHKVDINANARTPTIFVKINTGRHQ